MPDSRIPHDLPERDDWSQAFAALPLESPPAGSWNRIADRLPARRHRGLRFWRPATMIAVLRHSPARFWLPAAVAATLAVAIAWPWQAAHPPGPPPAGTAPALATTVSTDPREDTPALRTAPSAAGTARVADAGSTVTEKPGKPDVAVAASPGPDRTAASRHDRTAATGRQAPAPAVTTPADTAVASPTAATVPADTLESLYAESAQLEALLGQIRDDRVASAPAMTLSAELLDRIAGIDAALSQPDTHADLRRDLWQQRVTALRRLTGVEGTQRWMAASGFRADDSPQVY